MLDLELVTPPTQNGLDILSLVEAKKHLRITHAAMDDEITSAIMEAGDKLHGRDGELNRSVFPCQWRRYLRWFPDKYGCIKLPYPPLISVDAIDYDDGVSPLPSLDQTDYVVRVVDMIPEISLTNWRAGWPSLNGSVHPRAISVTYTAGYQTYPLMLRRMMKIIVGHYLENKEATINEPRQMMINRAVQFGMEDLRSALRVPVAYGDWD